MEQQAGSDLPLLHDIPNDPGTAVTIQAMVFGNLGQECQRRRIYAQSSTGVKELYGEYRQTPRRGCGCRAADAAAREQGNAWRGGR